jgi:CMP-N,N'-diacetyllegionaminic acid synthase
MDTLVIIPARGGSKGIPGKNLKKLGGVPLLHYTISVARTFTSDDHICVSSDDQAIIECAEELGLMAPFKRPAELATDTSGSYEVLLHALNHYNGKGLNYKKILLLQPTSPFRLSEHLQNVNKLYREDLDMVVSVGVSPYNPYFSLFEDGNDGYLVKSKEGRFERRQDVPPTYFYNGSIYLINASSLREKPLHQFSKVKKYVMEDLYCQDIDTPLDWLICEAIIEKGLYAYAHH